jgi:hypothetical protein
MISHVQQNVSHILRNTDTRKTNENKLLETIIILYTDKS